jgi:hypothetical protein
MNYTDDVNGIIIGEVQFPYEFWIDEPRPEYQDKRGIPKRRVTAKWFENDEQAVGWFKAHYPAEYKHGVEMRVWDKP